MSSRSPYPPDPENAKRRSTLMTRTRSACRCARRRRASSRITDEGAVFAFLAFGFAGCRARDRGPRRTGRLGTTWHGFPDKRQSAGTNGGNVGQADAEIPHKRSDATKALRLGVRGSQVRILSSRPHRFNELRPGEKSPGRFRLQDNCKAALGRLLGGTSDRVEIAQAVQPLHQQHGRFCVIVG